jgi:hypothetical protein
VKEGKKEREKTDKRMNKRGKIHLSQVANLPSIRVVQEIRNFFHSM